MTIQTINIGTVPNDGTGDSARTSFDKINQNFTDPANGAAALVQTSPTDTTAGRLMAVGAFGWGVQGAILKTNADDILESGAYRVGNATVGNPLALNGEVLHLAGFSSASAGQLFTYYEADRSFFRRKAGGIWQPPVEIFTGANYQPETDFGIGVVRILINNTASTISAGGTVSGTNLSAIILQPSGFGWTTSAVAVVGTWKNISGSGVGANLGREFVRIA